MWSQIYSWLTKTGAKRVSLALLRNRFSLEASIAWNLSKVQFGLLLLREGCLRSTAHARTLRIGRAVSARVQNRQINGSFCTVFSANPQGRPLACTHRCCQWGKTCAGVTASPFLRSSTDRGALCYAPTLPKLVAVRLVHAWSGTGIGIVYCTSQGHLVRGLNA